MSMHPRSFATVLGAALLLASPALAQAPSSKAAAIPGLPFSEPQTVAEFMKGVESDTTGLYFVALAANTDPKNWNYGNVVDAMNQVLGRAALRQGNRDEARRALLAAGATPGSPQLNSYGPTFVLAREMLGKGEKDVVLQYLDSVG